MIAHSGLNILKHDHYQIELLADLDRVPKAGAIVVASFPKPKDGSGFPARVFAILPSVGPHAPGKGNHSSSGSARTSQWIHTIYGENVLCVS
jgi:hypothetical protein